MALTPVQILEVIITIVALNYVLNSFLQSLVRQRLSEVPTCAWEAITGLSDNRGRAKLPLSMADYHSNMFLPDIYSVYWHQLYHLEAGQSFVLSGKAPRARYFSFITYAVTGEMIGHINGTNIITDAQGNFDLEVSNTPSGRYVNHIKGTQPYLGIDAGVILFRMYVPQQDSMGAVALPRWRIFSGTQEVREVLECPTVNGPSYWQDWLTQGYALVRAGKVLNRKVQPCPPSAPKNAFVFPDQATVVNSFFGNPDNYYIMSCMKPLPKTKLFGSPVIAVITGKAPKSGKDVLYWSFGQNSYELLKPLISGCGQLYPNEQMSWQKPPGESCWVDENDRFAIIMSYERPEVPPSDIPFTWIPWGPEDFETAIFAMRQMNPRKEFVASLANYKGPGEDPVALKSYMGEFYPEVKYCSLPGFQSLGVNCPGLTDSELGIAEY